MIRKPFAAFDIEISKELENINSWPEHVPLGVTCAAVQLEDEDTPLLWQGFPKIGADVIDSLISTLMELSEKYCLLTWNGAAFDFRVLANETGRFEDCGFLAFNHVDMMQEVTFRKGYYLALDTALKGMGIEGKLKEVKLNNGEVKLDMCGAEAPAMWAAGEYKAVIKYLSYDVSQPLELAKAINSRRRLNWKNKNGERMACTIYQLQMVKDLFCLPEPDTSKMDSPPLRTDCISWIPGWEKNVWRLSQNNKL